MDISKINSKALAAVLELQEEREDLLEKLAKIEAKIKEVWEKESGSPVTSTATYMTRGRATASGRTVTGRKKTKRRPRGETTEKIVKIFLAAGDKGVRAVELAKEVNVPPQNIYNWIQTTSKRLERYKVERVGVGIYRLVEK